MLNRSSLNFVKWLKGAVPYSVLFHKLNTMLVWCAIEANFVLAAILNGGKKELS